MNWARVDMSESRVVRDHKQRGKFSRWCIGIPGYSVGKNFLVVLNDNPKDDKGR